MYFKSVLSIFLFLFILFGITACSLQPGSYNDAFRFSENSSTSFDTQWNDQLLLDKTVGFDTTTQKYYVLFSTTDLQDLNMQGMYAN